ncbi:hypothetical protein HCJ19_08990 [Listeria seeligeri]|uniref:CD3337/EF1877 family mobilome membrane protein n=3 Tax=Listeria seeligeri TaxID=1640 RepID=UPI0010E7BDE4|nr:hypothetical protein [Listeria seeligeri]EAD3476094.1 hypothetical protein [Listeria monocytogenes]EAG4636592.1 hypothetical protein [Listeria monocytogenes]EAH4084462.1 hypothetical protein [Listeria monocytogenes]EIF6131959.1 hypothetical protein [Listeria monocytogenes]MBC1877786.1 hypothetical protein [Listeria seeligeri]
MKWRKWLFLFLISCLLVMQAPSMIVQADVPIDYDGKTSESEEAEQTQDASKTAEQKKKEQSKKKNVTSAGVPLKIEQWDIGRYDPYVVDANWIEEAVGALSNALFGLNKIIVDTVDAGMDLLFNMNPLEKFADKMETVNKAVFGSLKTTYGKLFLIISLAFIFYQIAINRKSQGGIRSIVGLIGVLVITGLFMANQSFYVKTCNNIANVAQTTLLSACSVIVDLAGSEGEFVDNDKIDPKNVSKGTVAIMRNIYFDLAVEKPYLIMNYGTPDKTVINKKDGLDGLSRTDTLLSFKETEEGKEAKKDYTKAYEVDKYENANLASSSVYDQLGIAIISCLSGIALGIPFLAVAFLNFLIGFLILAVLYVIPFMFILSYLPWFRNSGYTALGQVGTLFVLKSMLAVVVMFIYLTCYIVSFLIPMSNTGTYFLNIVVLVALLVVMFLKRNAIVKFLTAGKVNSADGKMLGDIHKGVSKSAKKTRRLAGKGAKLPFRPLSNRRQQKKNFKRNNKNAQIRKKMADKLAQKEKQKNNKKNEATERRKALAEKRLAERERKRLAKLGQTNPNGGTDSKNERNKKRTTKATRGEQNEYPRNKGKETKQGTPAIPIKGMPKKALPKSKKRIKRTRSPQLKANRKQLARKKQTFTRKGVPQRMTIPNKKMRKNGMSMMRQQRSGGITKHAYPKMRRRISR